MGSSGADYIKVSGSAEAECPEATVEIKIKTLDSQTYTLRVDKCVPVPALKDQIATVTGVLSEQQRLICRGKVLKDDQLLSAYHVEDGHTLHLVVRQQPSESNPVPQGTSDASSPGNAYGSTLAPGLFVGTLNLSEQADGLFPDMSRIVSAVLGSIGNANLGSGSGAIDLNGLGNLRNSVRFQNEQGGVRDQPSSSSGASARPTNVPVDSMQLPVVVDSLTTLSQYLTHLREEFDATVGGPSGISLTSSTNGSNRQESNVSSYPTGQGGLPTPELLANVMLSTRQLVVEQAAECLLQLSRQLEDQVNVTDATERMRIQSLAWRSGAFFQNLGALLLELGRTTMTLRIGQTPDIAVVNAGPAVFVSPTGPNPIMVQPQPFQVGTGIGAFPLGSVHGPGISGSPTGPGFIPRNIDIRIRTGAYMPSNGSHRGATVPQNPGQAAPGAPNGENSNQRGTEGTRNSTTRGVEVRVLPIRTLVAAVPASLGRATSDATRGSMEFFNSVLGRVQHVTSENGNNLNASQGSDQNLPHNVEIGQQPNTEAAGVRNIRLFGVNVNRSSTVDMSSGVETFLSALFPDGQIQVDENTGVHRMNPNSATVNHSSTGEMPNGVEAFFSSVFPDEQVQVDENAGVHGTNPNSATFNRSSTGEMSSGVETFFSALFPDDLIQVHGMNTNSATGENGFTQNAASQETDATIEDGIFLSNILRHIMPIISESTETEPNISPNEQVDVSEDRSAQVSAQAQESTDQATPSRCPRDPRLQPGSKRQKRE
ncbi:unnamed protein product [Cuscuta epithymum]|uniref:Ubiquitin-like domain-containing protein n=1 Tax=Cuscuta epithymum TaxID=186058 RepID=A0AAV0D1B7_9ASTE|nr:unnamed protein product [Cuscuta epithymum]CAH9127327.1 unnamed protein product [Cuscuta epithymum]